MKIFEELQARGLIAQVTDNDEIKELINNGGAKFYIGFDPTADSLHVGHFMALCLMKRLQMSGLAKLPDYIVGADTPGAKAEKIRHIIEKFSGTPDNTYMIGDSMGDITEGRKAGVHTIAVTYG